MRIKDNDTLQAFEKAINNCSSAVYLVYPSGQQFNLKNPMERYEGIGRLLEDRSGQMELFTNDLEDKSIMYTFFRNYNVA